MTAWIAVTSCTGCGRCAEVCPGDLLALREGKAYLRTAEECWGCLACAKVCPAGAIHGRLPFVLADPGWTLRPVREDEGPGWRWILEGPDGRREEFYLGGRDGE